MKTTVCICGGGSQGHISAGVIGSNSDYSVNILTRRPSMWSHDFKTIDLDGREFPAISSGFGIDWNTCAA